MQCILVFWPTILPEQQRIEGRITNLPLTQASKLRPFWT